MANVSPTGNSSANLTGPDSAKRNSAEMGADIRAQLPPVKTPKTTSSPDASAGAAMRKNSKLQGSTDAAWAGHKGLNPAGSNSGFVYSVSSPDSKMEEGKQVAAGCMKIDHDKPRKTYDSNKVDSR